MALKLAGEGIGIQEKIELISYLPDIKNTGDLEAGTKTITATSEATGVANADYSQALTLPKPSDGRLVITRVASRLAVTIDSMTAGHLYCRVYVDAQDAAHRLFDKDWTSPGAKLDAVDTHAGNLSTIFDLLKDGAAHTFYFFFWVDSGNVVISLVQLWEGVGSCGSSNNNNCLRLLHTGLVDAYFGKYREGTGTPTILLSLDAATNWISWSTTVIYNDSAGILRTMLLDSAYISCIGTVVTDLNYIIRIAFVLRSEL